MQIIRIKMICLFSEITGQKLRIDGVLSVMSGI